jgi:flagellar hook-length control protein FliK
MDVIPNLVSAELPKPVAPVSTTNKAISTSTKSKQTERNFGDVLTDAADSGIKDEPSKAATGTTPFEAMIAAMFTGFVANAANTVSTTDPGTGVAPTSTAVNGQVVVMPQAANDSSNAQLLATANAVFTAQGATDALAKTTTTPATATPSAAVILDNTQLPVVTKQSQQQQADFAATIAKLLPDNQPTTATAATQVTVQVLTPTPETADVVKTATGTANPVPQQAVLTMADMAKPVTNPNAGNKENLTPPATTEATTVIPVASSKESAGMLLNTAKEQVNDNNLVVPEKAEGTPTVFSGMIEQQLNKAGSQEVSQPVAQPVHDPYQVAAQIVEKARVVISQQNNSEMTIQLKPEHLGELTLKVAVNNGVVSASFHSNNAEVRGVIEASLQQLKQEMSTQGLKVDHVGVYAGLGEFSSGGQRETYKQPTANFQSQKSAEQDFLKAVEATAETQPGTTNTGVDYRV